MKIKWLGHASFLMTSAEGVKVITDPYSTGMGIDYGDIKESADVILVSHEHPDHNNVAAVKGSPQVIKKPGSQSVKGIEINSIATYHDEDQGKQRGNNTAYALTIDGIRVCFLGDLGHTLSADQVKQIGNVDVLLVPVGGFFTVDAATATKVCDQLKPKVIIPMHFKTDKCGYPIAPVEDFLKDKKGIRQEKSSEVALSKDKLPSTTEIVVLQHAL